MALRSTQKRPARDERRIAEDESPHFQEPPPPEPPPQFRIQQDEIASHGTVPSPAVPQFGMSLERQPRVGPDPEQEIVIQRQVPSRDATLKRQSQPGLRFPGHRPIDAQTRHHPVGGFSGSAERRKGVEPSHPIQPGVFPGIEPPQLIPLQSHSHEVGTLWKSGPVPLESKFLALVSAVKGEGPAIGHQPFVGAEDLFVPVGVSGGRGGMAPFFVPEIEAQAQQVGGRRKEGEPGGRSGPLPGGVPANPSRQTPAAAVPQPETDLPVEDGAGGVLDQKPGLVGKRVADGRKVEP